jgi:hypothetical protein
MNDVPEDPVSKLFDNVKVDVLVDKLQDEVEENNLMHILI